MVQKKPILVAAGILQRTNDVLICQRHRSDAYGLQWEFPGGKVEPGETARDALRRELREELDLNVIVGPEVFRLKHQYPDRYVEVVFYSVTEFWGELLNRVFECVKWAPRETLPEYNFLEADRDLVDRLARGQIV
jgi:8-oxo-dGTP diphosphatase